jgi:hypothetical protein
VTRHVIHHYTVYPRFFLFLHFFLPFMSMYVVLLNIIYLGCCKLPGWRMLCTQCVRGTYLSHKYEYMHILYGQTETKHIILRLLLLLLLSNAAVYVWSKWRNSPDPKTKKIIVIKKPRSQKYKKNIWISIQTKSIKISCYSQWTFKTDFIGKNSN